MAANRTFYIVVNPGATGQTLSGEPQEYAIYYASAPSQVTMTFQTGVTIDLGVPQNGAKHVLMGEIQVQGTTPIYLMPVYQQGHKEAIIAAGKWSLSD
ncbi:hypothetical protein [Endozoicomonas sp. ALB115]|uniref:hypothetical protein n=1 Tax=Endozoicomonas sp. ALB115 TaxID=3403074 RepID=UPI003BB77CCF